MGREAVAADAAGTSFYEIFLAKIKDACGDEGRSRAELDELFDKQGVKKAQLDVWLGKAVDGKKMGKTRKAGRIRYRWTASR